MRFRNYMAGIVLAGVLGLSGRGAIEATRDGTRWFFLGDQGDTQPAPAAEGFAAFTKAFEDNAAEGGIIVALIAGLTAGGLTVARRIRTRQVPTSPTTPTGTT